MIAMKLAKAGYGSVEEIMHWSVDTVVLTLQFENFVAEYEEEYMKLNSPQEE